MQENDTIIIENPEPGIKLIRLSREKVLNALTLSMVAQLDQLLVEIARDRECRVVILAASGRAFCAGMDINSNREHQQAHPGITEKIAIQKMFSNLALRLRDLSVPVIAAVNGAAAGAGFALTLAADVRVASDCAKFLIASVKLGLTAGETGISYHLPRLIGASKAFEIMLTGRPIMADEALVTGLVSRVVERHELEASALDLAREIISNSPFAIEHTKRLMWRNLDASSLGDALELENQLQIIASMTDDFDEATLAFQERRAPQFTGR